MTAGTKKNLSDYFEIFIFKIPTNGVIFLHLVVAQSYMAGLEVPLVEQWAT